MAQAYQASIHSASASRVLGPFRGVDLTSAEREVDTDRLSCAENLWRDYASPRSSAVETFPGYRAVSRLSETVRGIYSFRPSSAEEEVAVVHAGRSLYVVSSLGGSPSVLSVADDLADCDSTAFVTEDALWLLDGTSYRRLTLEGGQYRLTHVHNLYLPEVRRNGLLYEQRNALADRFWLGYDLTFPATYTSPSEHLVAEVLSEADGTCTVIECRCSMRSVTVPSRLWIDGRSYRVVSVSSRAFQSDNTLEHLFIEEGVERIERFAFNLCLSLRTVSLPRSLTFVGQGAFGGCQAMETLALRVCSAEIEPYAFYGAASVRALYFEGERLEFQQITVGEKNTPFEEVEPTFSAHDAFGAGSYTYRLGEPCSAVLSVLLDAAEVPSSPYRLTADTVFSAGKVYYGREGEIYTPAETTAGQSVPADTYYEREPLFYQTAVGEDSAAGPVQITLHAEDRRMLYGKTLRVLARAEEGVFAKDAPVGYLLLTEGGLSMGDAIREARVAATFDGRVFLTGSSRLPNTVVYSSRRADGRNDPAYFGVYNHFSDGVGATPNAAMTASPTALFVYKADRGQGASVYTHTGADTGSDLVPRVYPATEGIPGVGCLGQACNFADDPVFLSGRGLLAVSPKNVMLERAAESRSTAVDGALLREELDKVKLCEAFGYLFLLCTGGRAYLADSRQTYRSPAGHREYEWYTLTDLGSYRDDLPLYLYESVFRDGAVWAETAEGEPVLLAEEPDGIPFGSVAAYLEHSPTALRSGSVRFGYGDGTVAERVATYVETQREDGQTLRYLVYLSEERVGGTFSEACAIGTVGDRLLLGTTDGTLLCVNTDLRGADRRLPASAYDRMGHRYTSLAVTAADAATLPHLTKTTEREGSVLSLTNLPQSGLVMRVKTDREGWRELGALQAGGVDFSTLDLAGTVFDTDTETTVAVRERTRRWLYKQYAICSDGFRKPFGIRYVAYRCRVAGRIKNR